MIRNEEENSGGLPQWKPDTEYKNGDCVKYGTIPEGTFTVTGTTYMCRTDHKSSQEKTPQNTELWERIMF